MQQARFDIAATPCAGLQVIRRRPIEDDRGFLCRFFCAEELQRAGFHKPVAQMNHSRTHRMGALRGLHFQHPPRAEMKMVSCLKGEVFDVAVDLRSGSPTFLQWHAEILSEGNFTSLLIPEGFAHGFQALSQECELLYLHSEYYAPELSGALNAQDPALAIPWPLAISEISQRDLGQPLIDARFQGVVL